VLAVVRVARGRLPAGLGELAGVRVLTGSTGAVARTRVSGRRDGQSQHGGHAKRGCDESLDRNHLLP
jgi:hypothetical protein